MENTFKENSNKPNFIVEFKTKWYSGKNSLDYCLQDADLNNYNFIVAYDYYIPETDSLTKVYGAYLNSKTFIKATKDVPNTDKFFYVVVRPDRPCCLYADIEWPLDWKSIEDVKNKFIEVVIDTLKEANQNTVKPSDFLFCSASEEKTNKGSLHSHIPTLAFNNVEEQKIFFNAVYKKLDDSWFFVDASAKMYNIKTPIDFGVYNKNRQIRLPYSMKRKSDSFGVRPLIPMFPYVEENYDITEWCITNTSNVDKPMVDVSKFDKELECSKRESWSKKYIENIVETLNIDITVDSLRGSNLITLKNKRGKVRKCLINGEDNKSDNAFLIIKGKDLHYGCHDEGCKGKTKIIHTRKSVNTENLWSCIPFKKFVSDCHRDKDKMVQVVDGKKVINDKEVAIFTKNFVLEMNKYCVVITGSTKAYVLYRQVVETKEGKDVKWLCKMTREFIETFRNWSFGMPFCKKITEVWLDSKFRREAIYEDMLPYIGDDPSPKTTFNTFTGLSITKEQALTYGEGNADLLVDFIKKVWCDNNDGLTKWVTSWMAHLVQKPWIKMKTSITLSGVEGTGKGSIVQLLGKIMGKNHYIQPSCADEIFGNFNSLLDNKILLFVDELHWGGDVKKTGQLKQLLSEETRTSNAKFAPKKRLTNMMNCIISSNETRIIPAGSRARRYTVLNVSNDMLSYTAKQKKDIWNFNPYTFAKYLYSLDIEDFNPNQYYQTKGLSEQKILSMSGIHKFVMDNLDGDEDMFNFGDLIPQKTLWRHFQDSSHHNRKYDSQKAFHIEISKLLRLKPSVKKNVKKRGGKGYTKLKCIEMPTKNECIAMFNLTYGDELIIPEDEGGEVGEIITIVDNSNPVSIMGSKTAGSML